MCVVTLGGAVMCWGDGLYAQSLAPEPVHDLGSEAVEVAIGGETACARTTTGHVMCWGYGADGELGDGLGTPYSAVPVRVSGF
jgi:alpha-tubulin suppressor-like RCC1 family protein